MNHRIPGTGYRFENMGKCTGWKLTDEDQSVDLSVDYDFEPEDVKEGVYKITFSTTGREFKIHTTDYFRGRSGSRADILPGRYPCYVEGGILI